MTKNLELNFEDNLNTHLSLTENIIARKVTIIDGLIRQFSDGGILDSLTGRGRANKGLGNNRQGVGTVVFSIVTSGLQVAQQVVLSVRYRVLRLGL